MTKPTKTHTRTQTQAKPRVLASDELASVIGGVTTVKTSDPNGVSGGL